MIRKLRWKFIFIMMISVIIVLVVLMGSINIVNYRNVTQNSDNTLQVIIDNGGTYPKMDPSAITGNSQQSGVQGNGSQDQNKNGEQYASAQEGSGEFSSVDPSLMDAGSGKQQSGSIFGLDQDNHGKKSLDREAPFNTRYFTVTIDSSGNIADVNTENIAAVSSSDATEIALELYKDGKDGGYYEYYRYKSADVSGTDGESETMYVFLDCTKDLLSLRNFLLICVGISILGTILVFVLVLFLSRIAVKPMAESYAKQKRFITDVSHEIKTPLAIIDANVEVIEMENGESEWTLSTKRQIERLTSLTEKLVFLSRMDEEGSRLEMFDFDISEAVSDTVGSFETIAEARGKKLETSIQKCITYYGDEGNIRQIVSLLVDNAIKYSDDGGTISVSLARQGISKVVLKVSNTLDEIEKGNHDVLFERFYRADESRNSSTGGHGIGLSVVKAIVEAHKGKVSADSRDGRSITFTVTL